MYNILLDAHLDNTTSGVGLSLIELTRDQLEALPSSGYELSIGAGEYFGLSASMGMDLVCSQAKIYCDSEVSASGLAKFVYREFLRNEWSADGAYNYNTDYSTPIMQSNVSPDPYSCDQTSVYSSSYNAYKVFNQAASDAADCWHSAYPISFPQSFMINFPYGKVINKYALRCRNNGPAWQNRHFPRDWQLQGNTVETPDVSNDSHWETLDSREDVADPGQSEWTDYYTFANAKSYMYYRLRVSDANTESAAVALAELKLVEANRAESTPVYESYDNNMVWDGDGYVYDFGSSVGVERAEFYLGTTGGVVTVSGISLFVTDAVVSVSGVVASGVYVDNYVLTHRTLDPLMLNIRNHMEGWASPHMLFNFTGVFDIDRNIFISPDYDRAYNKGEASWYGLDYGYTVPELDTFDRGVLIDTKVEDRVVILEDDKTEGSWRSPVIDSDNKSVAAYVYYKGEADVYVRASETPPPLVNFLIVATDNTHRWMMYDHKRVYIDSSGQVVGSNECDPPEDGSKIWRWADSDWTASDLMYHGSINERGTACFVAPGYLECADISPEQEWEMPEYWYNCAICKLDDDSEWNVGTTISGLPYGEGVNVVMTKTFPVKGSDGFFCFSITSDDNVGVSSVNLSFHQDGQTRGSYPLLNMMGTVSPTSRVDVAYDEANNGWWVYLGSSLYKVDPGSINNIHIFNPPNRTKVAGEVVYKQTPDTMQGYIWKVSVDPTWKGIISIPSQDYSYFWTYSEKKIYLYEEKYESDEPEIILHATIDEGLQVDSGFIEFHQGCCDSYGNLWMLDISQERVVRVSLQKALLGDPRSVEYENQMAGAIGLWAHPTDGTCYILITDEPEHPNQDIIRMVHVNQRWGSQGKYVCAVPGFCSKSYKYGVDFIGKAFEGGVRPHNNDDIWGINQGPKELPWTKYTLGRSLPRGRYKQLRVDLSREYETVSSPRIEKVRLPRPIAAQPLPKGQDMNFALKTTFNKVRTPGSWDTKVRIWWFDEEI